MKKVQIKAAALKRLIQATRNFTENGGNKPIHEYIRLEFSKEFNSVTAVAVNSYRMLVEHASCMVEEDFIAYIKPVIPPAHKESWATIELKDSVCYIDIDGIITGYQQPEGNYLDWMKVLDTALEKPPQYRIGFNGDYLLSALQAAKASVGDVFRSPVVLEFRGPTEPILLKTNKNDYKMVLPVRLGSEGKS